MSPAHRRGARLPAGLAALLTGLLVGTAGAQPVAPAAPRIALKAVAPAASAASTPGKISPHALAAIQRAQAGEENQQAGFTLMGHGRPHRPQMPPHSP